MENAAWLIPHRLARRALPLLLENYKKAPPFSQNTPNQLQKGDSREAFYFKKDPKLKFLGWDPFQV